jgi:hypothetical protein
MRIAVKSAGDFIDVLVRFLYADPTPSALQVFLRRPGTTDSHNVGLPAEQGQEEGIWINADPIPGCVVCNIGESECLECPHRSFNGAHCSVGDLDGRSVSVNPPSCCPPRLQLSVHSLYFHLTSLICVLVVDVRVS